MGSLIQPYVNRTVRANAPNSAIESEQEPIDAETSHLAATLEERS